MTETVGAGSLALRLDYGDALVGSPSAARAVAEVLVRPCFAALNRLSARHKDRWSKHTKPSVEIIVAYLTDPANDAISMDNKRGAELVAGAEIDNGISRPNAPVPQTRLAAYVAVPFVAAELDAYVASACDLAAALRATAGFVALEPSFGLAHRVAVGGSWPKERPGLSQQRFRERCGRGHYDDRLATKLAGVEWGTFLGPGHLAGLDLSQVRASGAFARVIEVTPQLAYLQVSDDPADDLPEGFEAKRQTARRALAPVLMNVSGISLE